MIKFLTPLTLLITYSHSQVCEYVFEKENYCNDNDRKLKFYVNGQLNNEFYSYVIKDLNKILISYGNEDESEIQKQLDSITNLAPKYSLQG